MTAIEITNILKSIEKAKGAPVKIMYTAQIPVPVLNAAIKAYAYHAKDEPIVALVDTTMFGSGKGGFVFTTKYIYSEMFKMSTDKKDKDFVMTNHGICVPYEGLVSVEKSKGKMYEITLTYENNKKYSVYASIYTKWIMNFFENLIGVMKKERAAQIYQNARNEIKKANYSTDYYNLNNVSNRNGPIPRPVNGNNSGPAPRPVNNSNNKPNPRPTAQGTSNIAYSNRDVVEVDKRKVKQAEPVNAGNNRGDIQTGSQVLQRDDLPELCAVPELTIPEKIDIY